MHLVCVYDYVMLFLVVKTLPNLTDLITYFMLSHFSAHFLLLFGDLRYVKQLRRALRTTKNIALVAIGASALPYTNAWNIRMW